MCLQVKTGAKRYVAGAATTQFEWCGARSAAASSTGAVACRATRALSARTRTSAIDATVHAHLQVTRQYIHGCKWHDNVESEKYIWYLHTDALYVS